VNLRIDHLTTIMRLVRRVCGALDLASFAVVVFDRLYAGALHAQGTALNLRKPRTPMENKKTCNPEFTSKTCCVFRRRRATVVLQAIQLLAADASVPNTMKNAAKCANSCETH
jgi:hypothetical protein